MKILISFFVIVFSVHINEQDKSIAADKKKIFDNVTQESVFVRYNSSFYGLGECIDYKVYCLNAETKKLSQVSKMSYLELIAENGQRVFRQKIRLENGLGQENFFFDNSEFVFFSDRNSFRVPDFYRLSIDFNIVGNNKIKKFDHSFWTIPKYNVVERNNPFSVSFLTENGEVKGTETAIFNIPVPAITYNFKF